MATAAPEIARRAPAADAQRPADVLVVFGITGDLAKVMTFRSLYRLERRGLLDCPIVGVAVDDWDVDQLKDRAKTSIESTGEQLDPKVFERLADRLSYVEGDFGDAATYERVAKEIDGAQQPVFYLEIPPFLFGRVVQGRSATTAPLPPSWLKSCTSTSTSRSSTASTTTSGRWGSRRFSTCGSRMPCSSRSGPAITSSRCRSR